MKKAVRAVAAAVLLTVPVGTAVALDGLAIEAGSTHSGSTHMAGVALQERWPKHWLPRGGRHLGGYWNLALGHWNADIRPGQNADVTEIGLTPVLRFQPDGETGFFVEGGIGLHLLSQTRVGNRRLSTSLQFNDWIGAGIRFGRKGAYELGYRFRHVSNGDIKRPNDGVDFHQVRLQVHFQ